MSDFDTDKILYRATERFVCGKKEFGMRSGCMCPDCVEETMSNFEVREVSPGVRSLFAKPEYMERLAAGYVGAALRLLGGRPV